MKKLIVATGIIVGLVAWAVAASAHVPTVTANCDGLTVTGVNYNPQYTNIVVVSFDGKVVDNETFTDHFSFTVSDFDKTISHTYQVDITASDGIGVVHTGVQTIAACQSPPTTTTTPTTTTVVPQRTAPPVAPPVVRVPTPVTVTAHFTG